MSDEDRTMLLVLADDTSERRNDEHAIYDIYIYIYYPFRGTSKIFYLAEKEAKTRITTGTWIKA